MTKRKLLSVVAGPALASVILGGLPAVTGCGAVAGGTVAGGTAGGGAVAGAGRLAGGRLARRHGGCSGTVGGGAAASGTAVDAAQ